MRTLVHRIIGARLDAFERRFSYNMDYGREILHAGLKGFRLFASLTPMASYRDGVPLEAWTAAKWVAAHSEGCGPCQQLCVDMALQAGAPPAMLRAITQGDLAAMGDEVALVYQWARAVIMQVDPRPDQTEAWRRAIIARWGERGLVSLTLAMAATRSFPMVKRALGHAPSCQIIRIDAA